MTFGSQDNNVTILGFAVIREREHVLRQDKELGEHTCLLCMIEIPHAGNQAYMGVLDMDRTTVRLCLGNMVKVNLNADWISSPALPSYVDPACSFLHALRRAKGPERE